MEITDTALRRSQWETKVGGAALQHGWAYGAVAARHGATCRRFELRDGERHGLAQVICRSLGPVGIGYLPLGIRWISGDGSAPGDLTSLRQALSAQRMHLLVAPSEARPQRWAPRLSTPREMAVLRLDPGADQRAALQKKWRNRLNVAERSGLETRLDTGIPVWLVAAERAQQKRRGYGNFTSGWIAAWQKLAPGRSFTIEAGPETSPFAAMSFLLHGQGATYFLGWRSETSPACHAHNLLMWRAILHLQGLGVVRLDLGQIDRRAAPGLARFKLGTGAKIETLPALYAIGPSGRGRSGARDADGGRAFLPVGSVK
ncbi:acetyltransferase (GNAT) family protein [Palleronia aestuarii]|uniref:Acetyltransferase (GNAT) family protein n=1 Tax=Palleronia aestuarii TaxID=568105 RepID=A0A2W7P256_9RHOB|nr:GNAT family N-acetyltransferase [Palleronia aestuarii]PZX17522.1 acetyltransferase (GNAT) family protein [Palleronia aestuarii]